MPRTRKPRFTRAVIAVSLGALAGAMPGAAAVLAHAPLDLRTGAALEEGEGAGATGLALAFALAAAGAAAAVTAGGEQAPVSP